MRIMVFVKANAEFEAGVMLPGEGLQPSSKGTCLRTRIAAADSARPRS